MRRAIMAAIVALATIGLAEAQERNFLSGYAGAVPNDPSLQPRAYFNRPEVNSLFSQLEAGPISTRQGEEALSGSETTVEDLLRTHLLRQEAQQLLIDFAYFSQDDMARVHAAVERRVPSLARAYANRREEFEGIFARYGARGVSRADLAFVIIVGISLNWDGLRLTLERGWRAPRMVQASAAHYSFWASAATPDYSYDGFYWGSSSFPAGPYNFPDAPADYTFSSFGDPSSDPRMNFPDLLYLPKGALTANLRPWAEQAGLRAENLAGASISDALGFSFARPVSTILFALRAGPKSETALARLLTEEDAARLPAILALLEEAKYIARDRRGRYVLTAPVLDRRDARMLNAALSLSREIMAEWLSENYEPMRQEIGQLTIERHSLPYEAAFTQIWHELFGATTRELVKTGVVADPRASGVASPGSVPLLWRMSLYEFTPG